MKERATMDSPADLAIIAAEAWEFYGPNGIGVMDLPLYLGPIRCARCLEWDFKSTCGMVAELHPTGPTYWGDIGDEECHCGSRHHIGYGDLMEIFRNTGYLRSNYGHLGVPDELLYHYCNNCKTVLRPFAARLRDIFEVMHSTNNLERAIREKRKQGSQDDRATPHDAGKRRQGSDERRLGN